MRCDEVMDLLQRNLDNDLSPHEYTELAQHLQTCNECREWNERLTRLAAELEALPNVDPPFSLVDSIMPQLIASTGPMPNTSRFSKSFHNKRKYWMAFGGSVAAILAVALLWGWNGHKLAEQPQMSLNSTPSTPQMQSNDSTKSQENKSDVSPMAAADAQSKSEADRKSLAQSQKEGFSSSSAAVKPQTPPPVVMKQPIKEKKQESVKHDSVKSNTAENTVKKPEEAAPDQAKSDTVPSDEPLHAPMALAMKPAEQKPAANSVAPQTLLAGDATQPYMAKDSSSSMQKSGVPTYPSPDGEWVASIESRSVVIRQQRGTGILHSHQWEAADHVNVYWVDDQQLVYELFQTNGMQRWVFNVKIGQEQMQ